MHANRCLCTVNARVWEHVNPQKTTLRPQELFVSCKGKKIEKSFCGVIISFSKNVFRACFILIGSWKSGKNFRGGIFELKLKVGLKEITFLRPNNVAWA